MADAIDLDSYLVPMPIFLPGAWPEQAVMQRMADAVANGSTWTAEVDKFKATHHLEDDKWVANE